MWQLPPADRGVARGCAAPRSGTPRALPVGMAPTEAEVWSEIFGHWTDESEGDDVLQRLRALLERLRDREELAPRDGRRGK